MIQKNDLFELGKITKTHAMRGELICLVKGDILEAADPDYLILSIDNLYVPFYIDEYRFKSNDSIILLLSDFNSAEQAKRLVGCRVFLEKQQLPAGYEAELDYEDLSGYTVEDVQLGKLGTITQIDTTTINTIIQLDNGAILPLHEDFIENISVETRTITLNLPEGLFEN